MRGLLRGLARHGARRRAGLRLIAAHASARTRFDRAFRYISAAATLADENEASNEHSEHTRDDNEREDTLRGRGRDGNDSLAAGRDGNEQEKEFEPTSGSL